MYLGINLYMYLLYILYLFFVSYPSLRLQIEPNTIVKISHFSKWLFLY